MEHHRVAPHYIRHEQFRGRRGGRDLFVGSCRGGLSPLLILPRTATHDFNGDGRSRHCLAANRRYCGSVADERRDKSCIASATSGSRPPHWQIVGTGDFNGDGKADILWRHTTGSVSIWLMNGASVSGDSGRRGGRRRLGDRRASATSTATARPTSCGGTAAERVDLADERRCSSSAPMSASAWCRHDWHDRQGRRLQRRRQGRHPVAPHRRHVLRSG